MISKVQHGLEFSGRLSSRCQTRRPSAASSRFTQVNFFIETRSEFDGGPQYLSKFLRLRMPAADPAIAKVFAEIPRNNSIAHMICTLWRVREVESYALSKFQPPMTLGDSQNVENTIRKIKLFFPTLCVGIARFCLVPPSPSPPPCHLCSTRRPKSVTPCVAIATCTRNSKATFALSAALNWLCSKRRPTCGCN